MSEERQVTDRGRFAPSGTTIALVAVATLLTGALVLIFAYQQQVRSLQGSIYRQCVARAEYDSAAQNVRLVARDYWEQYIHDESTNRFIDGALRGRRIAGAQRMVDALSDTLKKGVRGGCDQYR